MTGRMDYTVRPGYITRTQLGLEAFCQNSSDRSPLVKISESYDAKCLFCAAGSVHTTDKHWCAIEEFKFACYADRARVTA